MKRKRQQSSEPEVMSLTSSRFQKEEEEEPPKRKQFNTGFDSELTSFSSPHLDSAVVEGEVTSSLRQDGGFCSFEMTCVERKVQQAKLLGVLNLVGWEMLSGADDHDARCELWNELRAKQKISAFNNSKRKLRRLLRPVESRSGTLPQPTWTPPRSPYELVQERLFHDPWKVIMACIFLHGTSGIQMKKVLDIFFQKFSGPQQVIDAERDVLLPLLQPLGFYNKRIKLIKGFSQDYLYTNWTDVVQLHGVGPYAADAYRIFVEGRWREVIPDDSKLDKYWNWLHMTSSVNDSSSPEP